LPCSSESTFFNYIDRYVLAAVEPEIRSAFFAPSDPNAMAVSGLLGAAFFVTYMLSAPALGSLSDRFSHWVVVGTAVILWSLASGGSGFAATDFSGGMDDITYALAVQPDNKIVLGGRSGFYPEFDFAVTRYTSAGQLDPTFGSAGKVLTPVAANANGYAASLQNGKIILAGAVANSQSPFDFGVARYLAR
jgi:uncharacterized delta-60 repeat protein